SAPRCGRGLSASARCPGAPGPDTGPRAAHRTAEPVCADVAGPATSAAPPGRPSAESSDRFGHDQMRLTLTAIIGIEPGFEFGSTQQPVWFRYRTLPMDPFRFNRVEPWTFTGQGADDNAHTLHTALDPLIVLAYPIPHG